MGKNAIYSVRTHSKGELIPLEKLGIVENELNRMREMAGLSSYETPNVEFFKDIHLAEILHDDYLLSIFSIVNEYIQNNYPQYHLTSDNGLIGVYTTKSMEQGGQMIVDNYVSIGNYKCHLQYMIQCLDRLTIGETVYWNCYLSRQREWKDNADDWQEEENCRQMMPFHRVNLTNISVREGFLEEKSLWDDERPREASHDTIPMFGKNAESATEAISLFEKMLSLCILALQEEERREKMGMGSEKAKQSNFIVNLFQRYYMNVVCKEKWFIMLLFLPITLLSIIVYSRFD